MNSAQRDHISPQSKYSDFVIRGDAAQAELCFIPTKLKKTGIEEETAVSSSLETIMFPSDRPYKLGCPQP